MRSLKIAAASVTLAGVIAGCMGPTTGASPVPTTPIGPTSPSDQNPAPTVENPIAGPSDGLGKPSPSLEVPPPAY